MRHLTQEELRSEKGIRFSRTYLYKLTMQGRFPKPVKQGLGVSARNSWREDEIDEWIEQKARERFSGGEAA